MKSRDHYKSPPLDPIQSQANPDHTIPYHLTSISVLPSHLRLDLQRSRFLSALESKTLQKQRTLMSQKSVNMDVHQKTELFRCAFGYNRINWQHHQISPTRRKGKWSQFIIMNWDGPEWWPIAIWKPNFVTKELARRVGSGRSGEKDSHPIFEPRSSLLSLNKLDVKNVLGYYRCGLLGNDTARPPGWVPTYASSG
jgi:hypothetical protein